MAVLGNNIVILVQNGQNWEAIAATKSDRIQVNGEMIEINDPDSGQWRKFLMGKLSWALNIGWLVTQAADLRKVLLVGSRVKVRIGQSTFSASSACAISTFTAPHPTSATTCSCSAARASLSTSTCRTLPRSSTSRRRCFPESARKSLSKQKNNNFT